jgi:iron complex transport system substrate-binding protein
LACPTTSRTKKAVDLRLALFVSGAILLSCGAPPPVTARREVTDDLGRAVSVPLRIERVVTLAPNLTELVFAAGGGEKLVGTDDFSNHPREARRLPKVGGMQPDIERVVSLEPDVVLASTEGNQPGIAPSLAAAGVPLFVVRTDRLAEISTALSRIGDLLGTGNGETAASTLRDQVRRQMRRRTSSPRLLFAVWADPLFVAGTQTFTDDLFALCGARNTVTVKGWPQFSHEALLADPPDIILYPRASVSRQSIGKLFAARPDVLRRLRIVGVDDDIFTRPGPRVVTAAAALNEIIGE